MLQITARYFCQLPEAFQVTGHYFFLLFSVLKVMRRYIFQLLEAFDLTAVSFTKKRAHLCMFPRIYDGAKQLLQMFTEKM